MRILILNCDFDPDPATNGACIIEKYVKKNPLAEVVCFQCFENKFPTTIESYDGVVITGSRSSVYENLPWIERLRVLIRTVDQRKIPLLGICFGLQIIADALGGKVQKSRRFERGYKTISIDTSHWLFCGMPAQCIVYQYHGDFVSRLPENARVLSQSWCCEAFCVRNNMGVQFHPEITLPIARQMAERDGNVLDTSLVTSEELTNKSLKILDNFLRKTKP